MRGKIDLRIHLVKRHGLDLGQDDESEILSKGMRCGAALPSRPKTKDGSGEPSHSFGLLRDAQRACQSPKPISATRPSTKQQQHELPPRKLSAHVGAEPVLTGMLTAIAIAAIDTDVRRQTLALVAGGRVIILGFPRPPPTGPSRFAEPHAADAVVAAVARCDAGLAAAAIDGAMRSQKRPPQVKQRPTAS